MRVNFQAGFNSVFHAALGALAATEARSKYAASMDLKKQDLATRQTEAATAKSREENIQKSGIREATAGKVTAETAKTAAEAKLINEQAKTVKADRTAKRRAEKAALSAIQDRYEEIVAGKQARDNMGVNKNG